MSQPTSQISSDTAAEEMEKKDGVPFVCETNGPSYCGSAYLRDPHIADERMTPT